jgi:hypothetical protein
VEIVEYAGTRRDERRRHWLAKKTKRGRYWPGSAVAGAMTVVGKMLGIGNAPDCGWKGVGQGPRRPTLMSAR